LEGKIICLDTSILIDYFRKQNKRNSKFYKLKKEKFIFAVSIITVYEIYIGANENQKHLWDNMFKRFKIIPLNEKSIYYAVDIYKSLKRRNKLIEVSDIFIAATAKANNLKFCTNNVKHFDRIEGLAIHNFN